ncbi:MAG: hypothetical protein R3A47_01275 [Polyangiales bacterium]
MAKKKNNNDNESKKPEALRHLARSPVVRRCRHSAYRESMAPPVAEQPASMSYVKRLVRAKIRRRSEEEHHGINIYPMMDMMTILSMFCLKLLQFASSTAFGNVQEKATNSNSIQHVGTALGESVPIQISQSEILVDGIKAVDLRNGIVDPSFKKSSTGFPHITPLEEQARHRCATRANSSRRTVEKTVHQRSQISTSPTNARLSEHFPEVITQPKRKGSEIFAS